MREASKELIKDKMCLEEDPGRSGRSRLFDPPCRGVGSRRSGDGEGAARRLLRQRPRVALPGTFPEELREAVRQLRFSSRVEGDG